MFTKAVCVSGDLLSTFVFLTEDDRNKWIKEEYPRLQKEFKFLDYDLFDLSDLDIGDECFVIGEGDDTFIIQSLIKYSPHRYGFVLDSGWSEEVYKCYRRF